MPTFREATHFVAESGRMPSNLSNKQKLRIYALFKPVMILQSTCFLLFTQPCWPGF